MLFPPSNITRECSPPPRGLVCCAVASCSRVVCQGDLLCRTSYPPRTPPLIALAQCISPPCSSTAAACASRTSFSYRSRWTLGLRCDCSGPSPPLRHFFYAAVVGLTSRDTVGPSHCSSSRSLSAAVPCTVEHTAAAAVRVCAQAGTFELSVYTAYRDNVITGV